MTKDRKGSVNARMVAKIAGVSQSAVSRTFTPGASVSPTTKAKIMRAAAKLGYRPNALARSLITNKSGIVGVVMSYLDNQFYPALLEKLVSRLRDHDYQVLLFTNFGNRDTDPVAEQVVQYQVDGLILASTTLSSELAEICTRSQIPVVLINRTTASDTVCSVVSNNERGGRLLAEYLIAGGHRRIGYIAGIHNSSTNRDRLAGLCSVLASSGLPEPIVAYGEYSLDSAARAARELLMLRERPDAIFCANDHMAFAVMDVARHEFGLRIPRDISIVGYDNAGPARWPSYDLTTVEQPVDGMADATVELLLGQIRGDKKVCRHVVLDGDLVIGSSARRPSDRA
ncbi:LacI family DNA-binding transcriptional regulator [Bradyrhizobium sp.]|uniref:LacI family DNA-binding transcriptional regulator n=1 Tax=Bradyrhizobium sp. TaxID=376 RepID=UPI0039E61204